MNAPLHNRELAAASGTLQLFALFHLNLAFSSIEEEQRGDVIARCYWPLLRLAEKHAAPSESKRPAIRWRRSPRAIPHGSRSCAATCSPHGRVELIGSGYSADDRAAGAGARHRSQSRDRQ